MGILLLQEKIENLQSLAESLLHIGGNDNFVYADDLSQLNKKIHETIIELYPLRGKTVEQEAALCLALLLGFSVSMYADPEDDLKRQTVLGRSQKLLKDLSPSSLKQNLLSVCREYKSV